jgi:geranylgeranyl diphosphate synthase type II
MAARENAGSGADAEGAKAAVERALAVALDAATKARPDPDGGCAPTPPLLDAALRHAVLAGGGRFRPRLTLAVARACGSGARGPDRAIAEAAAVAVELIHCASLVHDDLPCFDDADTRRGRPSVHSAFGEPIAVLTGDALIVAAFQHLARHAAERPDRLAALIGIVGAGAGLPCGIVAGQAWESESAIPLEAYQRAKTGALFAAATEAGAAAVGADPRPWRAVGATIGEAYQVADDLRDAAADAAELGKPVGRDLALGRPSAALRHGLGGAARRLETLMADAARAVPACPGAAGLRALIEEEARHFLPKALAACAA